VFQVEPLVVAGPGTFPDEALVIAGAVPAAPREGPAWPTWSLESLLTVAPEVLVAAEGPDAGRRLRALLTRLGPAGERIRVVAPERPILMRPGPSLHEDVAALARLISTATAPSRKAP
jgi:iron complex transport system substrate-binding protein